MPIASHAGKRFGKLVVVRPTEMRMNTSRSVVWEIRCDCGTLIHKPFYLIKSIRSKSCGCTRKKSNKDWGRAKKYITENPEFKWRQVASIIGTSESYARYKLHDFADSIRAKAIACEPIDSEQCKTIKTGGQKEPMSLIDILIKENLKASGRTTGAHVVHSIVTRNSKPRAEVASALERLVKRGVIIRDPADYIKLAGAA